MTTFWNIVFSVFFVGLIGASFLWLLDEGLLRTTISLGEFLLLSLATFRLVRLFSYDHITAFLRNGLQHAAPGTFLSTAGALLGCPWCTGMWFAFLLYVGYCAYGFVVLPLAILLAIAAMGSLFQLVANFVGWSAEERKLSVTQKQ